MADKDINITYEALFELLRRERDRNETQKLSETFYDDVIDYIKEKHAVLNKIKPDKESEKEKVKTQIENIKKIVTELYERREKKILDMALNKSRIKGEVNTSVLLSNEKQLFEKIVALLKEVKTTILNKVLLTELPEDFKAPTDEKKELTKEQPEKDIKKIRFVHPVPSFIGKNLETYGPFEENETTELPTQLANILINKGRAIELNQ